MSAFVLPAVLLFSAASLLAAEGEVTAVVVTQNCSADVRAADSPRSLGRVSLEQGFVYEKTGTDRQMIVKLDDTRIAVLPMNQVRMRTCSREEFTQAVGKFNTGRDTTEVMKKLRDQRAKAACATCPKVSGSAQTNYNRQVKEIRSKDQALTKEALDWAAGKSPLVGVR